MLGHLELSSFDVSYYNCRLSISLRLVVVSVSSPTFEYNIFLNYFFHCLSSFTTRGKFLTNKLILLICCFMTPIFFSFGSVQSFVWIESISISEVLCPPFILLSDDVSFPYQVWNSHAFVCTLFTSKLIYFWWSLKVHFSITLSSVPSKYNYETPLKTYICQIINIKKTWKLFKSPSFSTLISVEQRSVIQGLLYAWMELLKNMFFCHSKFL